MLFLLRYSLLSKIINLGLLLREDVFKFLIKQQPTKTRQKSDRSPTVRQSDRPTVPTAGMTAGPTW